MSNTISAFLHELNQKTAGPVRSDRVSRMLYSTDASLYQVMPYGVLIPETIEDVHAAVEMAVNYKVPILPRTGGSSLAGQAVNEALVIDFSKHLNDIIELNIEEKWVRVRPGIVLDELNAYLRPHGLMFGPDPASANRAGMGGIVSNNSTGSHSIKYGMTADHILEVDALLGDGSAAHFGPMDAAELAAHQKRSDFTGHLYRHMNALVWDTDNRTTIGNGTPRHWRRCGGYNLDRLLPADVDLINYHPLWPRDKRFNLAKLFCGAEGTLGVLTELKLNLVPRPKMTAVVVVHFSEIMAALHAVPPILEVEPSAVELFDRVGITMCREVSEYARMLETFLIGDPNCILITEFYGNSRVELEAKVMQLKDHVGKHAQGVTAINPLYDSTAKSNVWNVRKAGLGLLMSVRSDYKPAAFIEDSAVPVEHLAEYVGRIEAFCKELGTEMVYYAHASAGCLHIRPMVNTKMGPEVDKLPKITAFAVELLGEYGGALSSEHGDGKARSWANEHFFGKELYGLYKQTKGIFDPDNIFNPGNIVDGPPMTGSLRFGATYQTIPIDTILDFSADQGFDRAVEMCNGAGVCRKHVSGTMCPSFMATREELDSTRGRANMLRAAMSGQLDAAAFTGEDVYAAMDLCISCKACKSECPSSVDMAKIKAEWLYHYQEANGKTLRSHLFANIGTLSKLASGPHAPLINWINQLGPVRGLLASALKIGGERKLPQFAFTPFPKWFKQRQSRGDGRHGRVVLMVDTYNSYNYPQVAKAAVELLELAGYRVIVPNVTDCGRPALSKGYLKLAQRVATNLLDHLQQFAQDGLSIVFLEPSELSAVRDDYAVLIPEDSRVSRIAEHCLSIEEFVARQTAENKFDPPLSDQRVDVLLHGHCHQKALVGTGPSLAMLSLPGNVTIREVDSGCCGMAGSFGYETEHYDVSIKMGERRLLPAVRAAAADTYVVAAGVSCRQQIQHGTGRRALHPVEFLLKLVDKGAG